MSKRVNEKAGVLEVRVHAMRMQVRGHVMRMRVVTACCLHACMCCARALMRLPTVRPSVRPSVRQPAKREVDLRVIEKWVARRHLPAFMGGDLAGWPLPQDCEGLRRAAPPYASHGPTGNWEQVDAGETVVPPAGSAELTA